MSDLVDDIIHEWRELRPDLDFSPLEVVSRLLRVAHYLQSRLDDVAAAYGLSHTGDLDVLTDLDRAGPSHERTPTELAEAQLLTAGGMTVRLNRLQAAGLIERRPNPDDGRGVLVRLTPLGRDLAEDALATLLDTQASGIRGLKTPDRAILARLLRDLLVALGDTPAFRPRLVVKRPAR
ncbi:MAG: MarR family transcriptional regulator [Acidimicrobiia bacterium]